jgi:uncharacterized membrane protein
LAQNDAQWFHISFWLIAAGVIGGLCAALFGIVDWFAIPSATRAKRIGLWHGGLNVVVVLLFIASWAIRRGASDIPGNPALALSFVAVLIALVGGWLGGELVDRLGVGVDNGAHLDAPSSLSGKPAATAGRDTRRAG